jgi:CheY-like chemotaxis protein
MRPSQPARAVTHAMLARTASTVGIVRRKAELAGSASANKNAMPLDTPTQKRVLVVDDDEVIATTLAMVLRSAGFHAVAAYGGQHALELLQSGSFDHLLSDVMMPQMTGIELAIRATKGLLVQSVLLMSGVSGTADLLANARKLGYDFEILAKPMHPTEVIDNIHRAFNHDV